MIMRTILMIMGLLLSLAADAQITRKGDTFVKSGNSSVSRMDSLNTKYFYEAPNIPKTPIFINKKNGRAYIGRRSKQTGKYRREYLDEDVSKALAKEFNITYIPPKKR